MGSYDVYVRKDNTQKNIYESIRVQYWQHVCKAPKALFQMKYKIFFLVVYLSISSNNGAPNHLIQCVSIFLQSSCSSQQLAFHLGVSEKRGIYASYDRTTNPLFFQGISTLASLLITSTLFFILIYLKWFQRKQLIHNQNIGRWSWKYFHKFHGAISTHMCFFF